MILNQIRQRLTAVELLPDFRALLLEVVAQHDHDLRIHANHRLPFEIFYALGGQEDHIILPFASAWSLLDIIALRLDHLYDDDPEEQPLPTAPNVAASYNLILALYAAAESLLDDLYDYGVPAQRLVQLKRLWNDCVLVAMSGEHRDLVSARATADASMQLDCYQQMVQAKAGALFALPFAGAATLVTEDDATIKACHFLGMVYGTLLQLGDDLLDRIDQKEYSGLTLPSAYANAVRHVSLPQDAGDATLNEYWLYARAAYYTQIDNVLSQVNDARLTTCVHRLFGTMFG